MTRIRTLPVLCLAGATLCCAPPPSSDLANFGCVESLQMPHYPALAVSARVEYEVTAAVFLSQAGSAPEVSVTGKSEIVKLFEREIRDAMDASRFSKACGGKIVTVVFQFVLPGVAAETVSVAPPNRFTISAPSPLVNP